MSDRVRVFLYFAFLVVFGAAIRLWLFPWLDRHLSERVSLIFVGLFLLAFLWTLTFILYFLWSIWGDSWGSHGWKGAVHYLVAGIWIALMLLVHVDIVRMMFGPIAPVVQKPIEQPRGVGVAIFGVVVFLVSLVYLFFLVQEEDSFWAQRFLDFKVFALWFGGGIYLIAISKVLEPLFKTAFGEWLTKHLGAFGGSDPKNSLIVLVPAIILASGVTMWHKSRP
jgi:hypothetical protein